MTSSICEAYYESAIKKAGLRRLTEAVTMKTTLVDRRSISIVQPVQCLRALFKRKQLAEAKTKALQKLKAGKALLVKAVLKIIQIENILEILSDGLTAAKPKPIYWTLTASSRREQAIRKWVARLSGQHAQYVFARDFLEPHEAEWGRYGMTKAGFELAETGYYQDSEGDFFEVFLKDGELEARLCSRQEVYHHFYYSK